MLKDLWLVHKETKILNKVDKWCVVLSHGDFEGMEFHGDKIWAKVITDIPETTHFPINDPSVKNPNKNKFHWKGNKRRTFRWWQLLVKILNVERVASEDGASNDCIDSGAYSFNG